ncbi:MAG: hypothetical protein HQ596_01840 [Candidatus Saganbacteria bacterium]|nr:hypothetical protein [Candidatus Saganbacteria bacterium]
MLNLKLIAFNVNTSWQRPELLSEDPHQMEDSRLIEFLRLSGVAISVQKLTQMFSAGEKTAFLKSIGYPAEVTGPQPHSLWQVLQQLGDRVDQLIGTEITVGPYAFGPFENEESYTVRLAETGEFGNGEIQGNSLAFTIGNASVYDHTSQALTTSWTISATIHPYSISLLPSNALSATSPVEISTAAEFNPSNTQVTMQWTQHLRPSRQHYTLQNLNLKFICDAVFELLTRNLGEGQATPSSPGARVQVERQLVEAFSEGMQAGEMRAAREQTAEDSINLGRMLRQIRDPERLRNRRIAVGRYTLEITNPSRQNFRFKLEGLEVASTQPDAIYTQSHPWKIEGALVASAIALEPQPDPSSNHTSLTITSDRHYPPPFENASLSWRVELPSIRDPRISFAASLLDLPIIAQALANCFAAEIEGQGET